MLVSLARGAKSASLSGLVAVALLIGSASAASAITYSTNGADMLPSLGDTIGSPFDQLTLVGAGGNFTSGDDIKLNDVTFAVGINALVPQNWTYSVNEVLTIAGTPHTITLPFSLAISYLDTLTFPGGTTYLFPGWKLVLKDLVVGPQNIGTSHSELHATLSAVPLPAGLPLLAAGLVGLGLLARLQGKKKAKGQLTAI